MGQMMSELVSQLNRRQETIQAQVQQQVQQQVQTAVQQAINQLLPQLQQSATSPLGTAASSAAPVGPNRSVPVPVAPVSSHVKLAKPNFFTGALNTNVDTWLFAIEQYCNGTGVSDDASRIGVAASYFKDLAGTWWYNRCEIEHTAPTTWIEFKTLLKQHFQPIAAARTARANLRYLKQGNRSVADYCQSFYKQIHSISDMSEADKLYNFTNGLSAAIFEEVDRRDPKNLQEAMTYAQATELRLRTNSRRDRPSSSYYPPRDQAAQRTAYENKTTTTTSSSAASAPMELGNINSTDNKDEHGYEAEYEKYLEEGDAYEPNYEPDAVAEDQDDASADDEEHLQAMHHSGARGRSSRFQQRGRVPNLGREEFIRLMKERKCLRCKKPGHFARDCTRPQQQSNKQSHF